MRALVILPTYDEAENVLDVSARVLAQAPDLDVLVVDDASPDGTADLVARAGCDEPRLLLLRRPGKLGLGSAYLAGFRHALEHGYDRVVTMDCDGSHDPAVLPDLLDATLRADVSIGSRYVPGGGIAHWPPHRRALSRFANAYTRWLLRLPVADCTSGFRCYRSEVIAAVDAFSVRGSGYSFLEEMVWRVHRQGFALAEVPILFADRQRGTSKIDRSEIFRAAWHVLATALRPPTLPPRPPGGAGGGTRGARPVSGPPRPPRRGGRGCPPA